MKEQQVANALASYQALALMLCDMGKFRTIDDRLVQSVCSKAWKLSKLLRRGQIERF